MSEISISREEATNWLEKSAPIFVCTPMEFKRFGFAINKAISDMEKLEKIEHIIKTTSSPFASDYAKAFREIEQIVKG